MSLWSSPFLLGDLLDSVFDALLMNHCHAHICSVKMCVVCDSLSELVEGLKTQEHILGCTSLEWCIMPITEMPDMVTVYLHQSHRLKVMGIKQKQHLWRTWVPAMMRWLPFL